MEVPPVRYRWVVLGLLGAAMAGRILVGASLGVLLPDMTASLGMTAVQQGWLGSALNLGNALLGVPGAWLFSRYNPRVLLALTLGISALLTFAQGLAPAYAFLLGFRVLSGIMFVSMSPARTLLVQQWFPLREIVLVNGITIAMVGVVESSTLSLTPFLLLSVGGWQNVMHSFGALGVATTLAWLRFGQVRDSHLQQSRTETPDVSPLLIILHHPALWFVALGQGAAPAFWWAYVTFWPTYMLDRFALPLTVSGFLFGLTSLGMVPSGLLIGWLCSRHPWLRRPVLWCCGLGLTLTALGMLFTASVPLLFVLCLLGGFSWGFVPIVNSVPFELPGVQPREVAVAASFVLTAGSLGGLLGPTLAGWLIELWSNTALALGVLALAALGVSLSGFALTQPRAERSVAPPEG